MINYSWYFKNMPVQEKLMNEVGAEFYAVRSTDDIAYSGSFSRAMNFAVFMNYCSLKD